MIDSPDPPAGSDDDDDADRRLDPLLDELAATPARDPRRHQLRDRLVTELLPVARRLARRFARRGVAEDDLFQVASLGLLKSLERYEPERATSGFLPYAIITMRGEIRRYFRDHTWSMRVPRRLKEATQLVSQASQELAAELERAPRPSEIATRTGLSSEEVLEALQAEQAYTAGPSTNPSAPTARPAAPPAVTYSAAPTRGWSWSRNAKRSSRCWPSYPNANAPS
jgi:RNA polymerase sigma factor (sigma-70 family)